MRPRSNDDSPPLEPRDGVAAGRLAELTSDRTRWLEGARALVRASERLSATAEGLVSRTTTPATVDAFVVALSDFEGALEALTALVEPVRLELAVPGLPPHEILAARLLFEQLVPILVPRGIPALPARLANGLEHLDAHGLDRGALADELVRAVAATSALFADVSHLAHRT